MPPSFPRWPTPGRGEPAPCSRQTPLGWCTSPCRWTTRPRRPESPSRPYQSPRVTSRRRGVGNLLNEGEPMGESPVLLRFALLAFSSVLIIVNPFSTAPLFATMTEGDPPSQAPPDRLACRRHRWGDVDGVRRARRRAP